MRILVTLAPLMYREALALAIHRDHPGAEVLIASPATLDGQAESFKPHLFIHNDTDGADMDLLKGALCWIEILYSDGLNARISLDGKVWEIEDISVEGLLALVEQVEGLIAEYSGEPVS